MSLRQDPPCEHFKKPIPATCPFVWTTHEILPRDMSLQHVPSCEPTLMKPRELGISAQTLKGAGVTLLCMCKQWWWAYCFWANLKLDQDWISRCECFVISWLPVHPVIIMEHFLSHWWKVHLPASEVVLAYKRMPAMRKVVPAKHEVNFAPTDCAIWFPRRVITWPSPKAGQVLKCRLFFILGGGQDGDWLDLFTTFSRHLGKAYTKYCPLSQPKSAECFCVPFHCLSDVVTITLNSLCRIPTYTLDAGDHCELFWSSFWLRWFSLLCTHWGQAYWHNASLVHSTINGIEFTLTTYV